MTVLDYFFKNKDKPRDVIEVEPYGEQAAKEIRIFLARLHQELSFIHSLDRLLSAPLVTHNVIKAKNNGLSWLNGGKPLIIVFNQKGKPLCAYFEGEEK